MNKPDTQTAMHGLIDQIRVAIPFASLRVEVCGDSCDGCSQKLLDYLESEVDNWESRLEQGERPNFGDLERLAKSARKIQRVLVKNGLLEPAA